MEQPFNYFAKYYFIILFSMFPLLNYGQATLKGDGWADANRNKKGEISVLWCEIEPFIYRYKGRMTGVEYELLQGFAAYLKKNHDISITYNWVELHDFDEIYPEVRSAESDGVFAVSYFSITDERKKEVSFSPPYMPDLNVMVSSNDMPVYTSAIDFIRDLQRMKGYSMSGTTMEKDLLQFKKVYPALPVGLLRDDYEVMNAIAGDQMAFGYIPLSIYVVGIQRGIKVKRQHIFPGKREGFAMIYPLHSDWQPAIDAYFSSEECKRLIRELISRHLGEEISGIILEVSMPDSIKEITSDIDLLTREREIVTGRLVNSALDAQRQKNQKYIILGGIVVLLILLLILYSRFQTKKKYLELLQLRNRMILAQKDEIEKANIKLQQRLAISQLNPHLIFNALTALQHYTLIGDKQVANKYLNYLSRFIRLILNNSEQDMISIAQEAAMLEQYLHLERLRFENRFDFGISIQTGEEDTLIPALLIFPFVEQVLYKKILKLKMAIGQPFLKIEFLHREGHVTIIISDNMDRRAPPGHSVNSDETDSIQLARLQVDRLNKNRDPKIIIEEKNEQGKVNSLLISVPDNLIV